MNKLILITLICASAAMPMFTGCKSIEVERNPQKVATYTDTNGVVHAVCDAKGKPVVLDGGWSVDYFQHWNWQQFDALSATAGTDVSLSINNYASGADSNLTELVHTSLEGATKLVAAVGEAYVKIAGGGAQADTALNVGQKVYSYFTSKGGDANKATVTTTSGVSPDGKTTDSRIIVSDGTTTVQCDKDGNCTDCTNGACTN